MKLETWLPIYDRICMDFGFDKGRDLESARLLAGLLDNKGVEALEGVRKGFPDSVLICGGSGGLADELSSITVSGTVVAADSATTVLTEAGITPDLVVTDLDGIVEDQVEVNRKGTAVFVHAHGDNMDSLRKHVSSFVGPVVGTCQCPPPERVFNFGGFTDGDRAACICASLGAKRISLAGFDFENPSEKLGRKRVVKMRKLRWAKEIFDVLAREGVKIGRAGEENETL